jgi:hypothetical protein
MAYIDVANMVKSVSLTEREYAAVSKEGIDPPEGWQFERRWRLAASPGWDAAWASAVAGGDEDPGSNPGVITDGMILSAVQALIQADNPPIPTPVLTSLAPPTMHITDPDFEGHLRGTGFTEDSVIVWNGADEPTRFVDSTNIWTMVVPSVVTAPTVLDVYVRNADGQVSNILPFTWMA